MALVLGTLVSAVMVFTKNSFGFQASPVSTSLAPPKMPSSSLSALLALAAAFRAGTMTSRNAFRLSGCSSSA
jgi:hypothetical protein